MEEKQIFDFIHRASHDETFRKELTSDPGCVIARENFSPRVMQVLMRLVPHLAVDQSTITPLPSGPGYFWI